MPKSTKRPPEPVSRENVVKLMAKLSSGNKHFFKMRLRALIILWYRAALRITESIDLMPRDILWDLNRVRVRHGKGDVPRVVGMDPASFTALREYQESRRKRLGGDYPDLPFICTAQRKPMCRRTAGLTLESAVKSLELEGRVYPHGFRHSCAFEMAMDGVPVPVISKHLGHANISTTQYYIDHLGNFDAAIYAMNRDWGGVVPGIEDPKPKQPKSLVEFREFAEDEGMDQVTSVCIGKDAWVVLQDERGLYHCISYQSTSPVVNGVGEWAMVKELEEVSADEALRWVGVSVSEKGT